MTNPKLAVSASVIRYLLLVAELDEQVLEELCARCGAEVTLNVS